MANTILKTVIQFKRDSSANWLTNKDVVPAAGEPCYDIDAGTLKIGDGTTTYENLPAIHAGEISSAASHYEGIKAEGESDMDVIARVLADDEVGETRSDDVFIVKTLIAEGKYSHTAYVYNGSAWVAMDGNYDASNVYFDSDLIATSAIGTVTIPSSGSATIEAAGKSLKQVLSAILAQEKNPTTTQPAITLSVSGGSGEVGSSYTLPTATLKLTSVGNYTYGPATGVTVGGGNATITCGDESATNSGAMVLNSTLTLKAVDDNPVYSDTAKSYAFSASAVHTDGAIPVTNIGNDYAAGQIKSATLTKSATATFTGYRSFFYGMDDTAGEINSALIRGLTNGGNYNASKTFTLKAADKEGVKRFIVAYPASSTRGGLSEVLLTSTMNLDITANYVQQANVDVEGVNGYDAVAYKVFVYSPPQIGADEVHQIKLA